MQRIVSVHPYCTVNALRCLYFCSEDNSFVVIREVRDIEQDYFDQVLNFRQHNTMLTPEELTYYEKLELYYVSSIKSKLFDDQAKIGTQFHTYIYI